MRYLLTLVLLAVTVPAEASPLRFSRPRLIHSPLIKYHTAPPASTITLIPAVASPPVIVVPVNPPPLPIIPPKAPRVRVSVIVASPIPPRPRELTAYMVRIINSTARNNPARLPSLIPYISVSLGVVLDQIIANQQVDQCAVAWGLEVSAARQFAAVWVKHRASQWR